MAEIPSDICREIFLRLPAKSLIRFRSVCKSWRHIIDDPIFVKAHTNKQLSYNTILIRNLTGPPYSPFYSIDLDTLNFANGIQTVNATPVNFTRSGLSRLPDFPVGVCNGLVLVPPCPDDEDVKSDKQHWGIWNPLTHERLELPKRRFHSEVVASGLGYDETTDDYKAVVVFRLKHGGNDDEKSSYQTHVYSLKWDSWRKIKNQPLQDSKVGHSNCVSLNGVLYWSSWAADAIIAFDVGTESYSYPKLPPVEQEDVWVKKVQLDLLGGYLIRTDHGEGRYGASFFEVWVMKNHGEQDSWIKLFSLEDYDIRESSDYLRPVSYMKNKMQILMHDTYKGIYLFDVESQSMKAVGSHGLSGMSSAQTFHGSIYRLRDNCGVSRDATIDRMRKRKMKINMADTKLTFCVRDNGGYSHYSCHYSSSEDGD